MELTRLFGRGATQDENHLILSRSDLAEVGLNGDEPEAVLAAIILLMHQAFVGEVTAPNGEVITDNQGRSLTYDQNQTEVQMNSHLQASYFPEGARFWEYTMEFFVANEGEVTPGAFGDSNPE